MKANNRIANIYTLSAIYLTVNVGNIDQLQGNIMSATLWMLITAPCDIWLSAVCIGAMYWMKVNLKLKKS
ncbi:hypothetical protein K7R09_22205 [Serratia ureilytica]|uniref:Uncharacterized protein n=1 Tax=Serratia ureilytica TaxID=300181 RepID=A0ABU0VQZ1_9GAMM|nr:hypothetical protein [Serratia ureilytica]MCU7064516.1 hypothetical protein [Serratia ureilytica]MDQ1811338.1 hypothetical protein [Serratia ureilytica]MDQ1840399.1 hypothetical protein [Serratia ureilytica]MDQ1863841.1 hypothetical protein [Serratia ureilytica]